MSAWRPMPTGRFGEDSVGHHPRALHRIYTGKVGCLLLSSLILLLNSCSLMQLLWKGLVKSMLQLTKSANYTGWCQVFLSEYQNVALDLQE